MIVLFLCSGDARHQTCTYLPDPSVRFENPEKLLVSCAVLGSLEDVMCFVEEEVVERCCWEPQ